MRIVFRMTFFSWGISLSLLSPILAFGQCPPMPEGTLPQSGKLALYDLKNKEREQAAHRHPRRGPYTCPTESRDAIWHRYCYTSLRGPPSHCEAPGKEE